MRVCVCQDTLYTLYTHADKPTCHVGLTVYMYIYEVHSTCTHVLDMKCIVHVPMYSMACVCVTHVVRGKLMYGLARIL